MDVSDRQISDTPIITVSFHRENEFDIFLREITFSFRGTVGKNVFRFKVFIYSIISWFL